jgi:capsule polysaccharide export protein KpsC/LpsZ
VLPEDWGQNTSDILLPAVSAVATVSSAVGLTALIAGKNVVSLGMSSYRGFCGNSLSSLNVTPTLTPRERNNLLCFTFLSYARTDRELFEVDGYFANILHRIDVSMEDAYFDITIWSERLKELL